MRKRLTKTAKFKELLKKLDKESYREYLIPLMEKLTKQEYRKKVKEYESDKAWTADEKPSEIEKVYLKHTSPTPPSTNPQTSYPEEEEKVPQTDPTHPHTETQTETEIQREIQREIERSVKSKTHYEYAFVYDNEYTENENQYPIIPFEVKESNQKFHYLLSYQFQNQLYYTSWGLTKLSNFNQSMALSPLLTNVDKFKLFSNFNPLFLHQTSAYTHVFLSWLALWCPLLSFHQNHEKMLRFHQLIEFLHYINPQVKPTVIQIQISQLIFFLFL